MLRFSQSFFTKLSALKSVSNCPPGLNDTTINNWCEGSMNVLAHLNSYLQLRPIPSYGPYEIHPYILKEKLQFDLSRKYLLLGTFPPNSYLHNTPGLGPLAMTHPQINKVPKVDFYYGNTANLWKYFFGNNILPNRPDIIQFLQTNSIAISDVILGVQRRKFGSYEDKDLYNILPNYELCSILDSNIETILFTSGSLKSIKLNQNDQISLSPLNTLTIFLSILKTCQANLLIEVSGDTTGRGVFYPLTKEGLALSLQQQSGHIIWWLKIGDKKFRIINLPTPATALGVMRSNFFRRWIVWKAKQNGLSPAHFTNWKKYMMNHPNIFKTPYTNQYRTEVYNLAIQNIKGLQQI